MRAALPKTLRFCILPVELCADEHRSRRASRATRFLTMSQIKVEGQRAALALATSPSPSTHPSPHPLLLSSLAPPIPCSPPPSPPTSSVTPRSLLALLPHRSLDPSLPSCLPVQKLQSGRFRAAASSGGSSAGLVLAAVAASDISIHCCCCCLPHSIPFHLRNYPPHSAALFSALALELGLMLYAVQAN